MSDDDQRDFYDLTPENILDAVECFGMRTDARLLALNSYENRVYQVGIEDGPPIVAKFYRPGRWSDEAILEEHAFLRELAEHELPVVAPLQDADGATLRHLRRYRVALFPRQGGYWPELAAAEDSRQLGRLLGRLHAQGAVRAFRHRPQLDVEADGAASRDYLLAHGFVPADLEAAYESVSAEALDLVRQAFARASTVPAIRLHGDFHRGNILWSGDGPHLVDFDDCRTGPAMQDLWMLLEGEPAHMRAQLELLLQGYESFRRFDARELHLAEPLRTLRLIHYSAWIARRWEDPAFPRAFPWFDTPRYWQEQVLSLREQLAAMHEPPLLTGY